MRINRYKIRVKNSEKESVTMQYYRLKKQADFQRLFNKGKRAFTPTLSVIYRPADKLVMGISVGKKHGKSVQRNRIKRLLREAFRAVQGEMKGTYSIVLIPKVSEEYSVKNFERQLRCIIKKEKM
ncbi:MAG: ribonuclease P protein component [Clostridia bacterium]|nr:ribonuclease P protein component [Clostridia bacterium]